MTQAIFWLKRQLCFPRQVRSKEAVLASAFLLPIYWSRLPENYLFFITKHNTFRIKVSHKHMYSNFENIITGACYPLAPVILFQPRVGKVTGNYFSYMTSNFIYRIKVSQKYLISFWKQNTLPRTALNLNKTQHHSFVWIYPSPELQIKRQERVHIFRARCRR